MKLVVLENRYRSNDVIIFKITYKYEQNLHYSGTFIIYDCKKNFANFRTIFLVKESKMNFD